MYGRRQWSAILKVDAIWPIQIERLQEVQKILAYDSSADVVSGGRRPSFNITTSRGKQRGVPRKSCLPLVSWSEMGRNPAKHFSIKKSRMQWEERGTRDLKDFRSKRYKAWHEAGVRKNRMFHPLHHFSIQVPLTV